MNPKPEGERAATCDYCLGAGKVWSPIISSYDVCPDCFGRAGKKKPSGGLTVSVEQFEQRYDCRDCRAGDHFLVPLGGAWMCPTIKARVLALAEGSAS